MVKNSSTPSSTLPMSSRTSLSLSIIVSLFPHTNTEKHFTPKIKHTDVEEQLESNVVLHYITLIYKKKHSGTSASLGVFWFESLMLQTSLLGVSCSVTYNGGGVTRFHMQNESKITHFPNVGNVISKLQLHHPDHINICSHK